MIRIVIPSDTKILRRLEITVVNKQKIRVYNYIGHKNPHFIILEGEPVE